MKPLHVLAFFFVVCSGVAPAQHNLSGTFAAHGGAEVRLLGYNGVETQVLDQGTLTPEGGFQLNYPHAYVGMGLLQLKDAGSLLVILSHEEVQLTGNSIQALDNLSYAQSPENLLFVNYVKEENLRNQRYSGWKWLQDRYQDPASASTLEQINQNIALLNQQRQDFLAAIPTERYVSYYLPLRQFTADWAAALANNPERIPHLIAKFKTYDLSDQRLWQSGLMQEFYEGHFMLLEGYDNNEAGYLLIKESIDHIVAMLSGHEEKLLTVSEHLFHFFEERSLFEAAAHLSVAMLTQNGCTVEGELERRFEQYSSMKEGNRAPDIVFETAAGQQKKGFKKQENTLYDIKSSYKLVAFWASWCEHCMKEIPKLQSAYFKLQEKDVEVVAISLDNDQVAFQAGSGGHTWYSYCDFKKWDSPAVQDYYVFATPSFYLLDADNKILKKIKSVAQLEAIVDTVLPQP